VNAVRDSERKVMRAWDEERFHDIFHEAVVLDGAAALDFQQGPVAVIAGVDRVRVDAVERFPVLAVQEGDPRERIAGLDVPAAEQATFEEDTSRVGWKISSPAAW
jgi:hypothetical protein